MLSAWVGKESKLLEKYAIVTEKLSEQRHCHIVVVYHKDTDQANVKSKVKGLFRDLIATDTRWDNPKIAIDVRAHHDPAGCVGGYLEKEEHCVLSCQGFDQEELSKGKQRRKDALAAKKMYAPNRLDLIPNLVAMHYVWIDDTCNVINLRDYGIGSADFWMPYKSVCPKIQVQFCFEQIIAAGYLNFLHNWTPTLERQVVRHWYFMTPARGNPTNDIVDSE